MKFWDLSAVVPLLVTETPRDELLDLLKSDPVMIVWWATPVECTSAIAHREREGALSVAQATSALEHLHVLASVWQEVLPSDVLRTTAQRLLRVHPLRAADALQLAAAVVACEHQPPSLEFLTLDEKLNEAASREGFRIVWT